MEQVIMVEVLYFSKWQKEKTHTALIGFKRRLRGFREVPRANFAKSAKRYGRITCQHSDHGVAT